MNNNDITENDELIEQAARNQAEKLVGVTSGLISGKTYGDYGKVTVNRGRITVRTDGSILLENLALSNIAIRHCDLIAESGENLIPFADRMNRLEDFAHGSPQYPDTKLWAGHTHTFGGLTLEQAQPETPCDLCGLKKRPAEKKQ